MRKLLISFLYIIYSKSIVEFIKEDIIQFQSSSLGSVSTIPIFSNQVFQAQPVKQFRKNDIQDLTVSIEQPKIGTPFRVGSRKSLGSSPILPILPLKKRDNLSILEDQKSNNQIKRDRAVNINEFKENLKEEIKNRIFSRNILTQAKSSKNSQGPLNIQQGDQNKKKIAQQYQFYLNYIQNKFRQNKQNTNLSNQIQPPRNIRTVGLRSTVTIKN